MVCCDYILGGLLTSVGKNCGLSLDKYSFTEV